MSEAPRKRRRVARFVSEVDRRLIAEGLPPSWEDRVRPEDTRPGSMADSPDRGDGANDARLLALSPHRHPTEVPDRARFPTNLARNSTRSLLSTTRKRWNTNNLVSKFE